MPVFQPAPLTDFAANIFRAHGVSADIAAAVARSLILADLKGHASHGVIRIVEYVDWLGRGWINPAGKLEVLRDQGPILAVQGNYQFGQVVGREAVTLALHKVARDGICILTICRSGHLGRMGEWMEMAVDRGYLGFGFTNTHGGGVLVAPHQGREARLSANPLAAGAPVPSAAGDNIIMDIATCSVAEGKIKVARDKGEQLPPGAIVNNQGEPSVDPADYFCEPPGAVLPFGEHKGSALSLLCEIFAGILTGGECSQAGVERIANGFFALYLDPAAFCDPDAYSTKIRNLVTWIKSAKPLKGQNEILLAGEPESRQYKKRSRDGIPIAEGTWQKILTTAADVQIAPPASI
jgi:uncharacterized oxidoreductase